MKRKTQRIIKNNYKLVLISIAFAILAHGYFLKNQFLNDQYMMGPYDQFSQMIIFKDLLYDEFSQGNFFYSFNYNGGANIFTRLSYYYSSSIVFYITALFTFVLESINIIGAPSMVYWSSLAVFINIFRSILILFVTTKYINIFVKNNKIALLGATFYAFSNIYFRHVVLWEFFGDAMIWLPIILYGVEYIIRKGDGKVFTLGVALTLFNNGYFGFANLLFTVVYVIIRMLFQITPKEQSVWKQFKNYLMYGLMGTLISLPGFLPFVLGFFNTSRLSPEFSIPMFDDTNLSLGNLLLNDQVQILPILFLIVVTYFRNYKSKLFRLFSIVSFILIFLRYSPTVASVFNGLSYPQFRWHYITFLMIAIVIAVGIKNIYQDFQFNKNKSILYFSLSLILTISAYYIANQQASNHYFNMKIVFSLIVFIFILLTIVASKKNINNTFIMVLLFLSSLYTIFVSNRQLYYDYNLYKMNYETVYQAYDNPDTPYEEALDVIRADSENFHRIDFTDAHNLGSQKKFSSFNVYSSFQNHYQQYFYRYFQIINSRENNGTIDGLGGRQTLSSILQSNYVMASENNQYIVPSSFEPIGSAEELSIYKNKIPLAFIHPVSNLYSYEEIGGNDFKDELLVNGAIVPEEISNKTVISEDFEEEIEFLVNDIGTETKNNILMKSDQYYNINIDLNYNYENYDDLVIDYTIKPLDQGETGRYTYFINDYSIQLKSTGDPYSSQLYRHQAHVPASETIEFTLAPGTDYQFQVHSIYGVSHDELIDRSERDSNLDYNVKIDSGEIDIDYDNVDDHPFMVLPIFYENGWELRLNGEKEDIINVNNGMLGFEIPPGEMNIELKFKQPFFIETIILSGIGIIALIYIEKRHS